MSKIGFHKIWSIFDKIQQEEDEAIRTGDLVRYHFAVFESLLTYKSKLLQFSYTDDPHSGYAGVHRSLNESENILFTSFLEQLSKFKCKRGERGMWHVLRDEKATGAVLFIEIIDDNNAYIASRHLKVKDMIIQYASYIKGEKLLDQNSLDDLIDIEELDYYACKVFWYHWMGQDLDNIVGPQITGVSTRREVAKAYGLQALRDLGRFLESQGPKEIREAHEREFAWLSSILPCCSDSSDEETGVSPGR